MRADCVVLGTNRIFVSKGLKCVHLQLIADAEVGKDMSGLPNQVTQPSVESTQSEQLPRVSESEERVPCHNEVKVLEQRNLFKTDKWWKAVVLGEVKSRKFLAIYMWQKRNGNWKQKHKMKLNKKADWTEMKPIIDGLIERL